MQFFQTHKEINKRNFISININKLDDLFLGRGLFFFVSQQLKNFISNNCSCIKINKKCITKSTSQSIMTVSDRPLECQIIDCRLSRLSPIF